MEAADALSRFMISGMPDPARFLNFFGNLIVTAGLAAKGEQARVAVLGEGVHLLWAHGDAEGRFGSKVSPIRYPRRTTWIFYAAIHWVAFGAEWRPTSSKKSAQSIHLFIPDERDLTQILDSNTRSIPIARVAHPAARWECSDVSGT